MLRPIGEFSHLWKPRVFLFSWKKLCITKNKIKLQPGCFSQRNFPGIIVNPILTFYDWFHAKVTPVNTHVKSALFTPLCLKRDVHQISIAEVFFRFWGLRKHICLLMANYWLLVWSAAFVTREGWEGTSGSRANWYLGANLTIVIPAVKHAPKEKCIRGFHEIRIDRIWHKDQAGIFWKICSRSPPGNRIFFYFATWNSCLLAY